MFQRGAEQTGGQRAAHGLIVVGVQHGVQDQLQLARDLAGKDVAAAAAHAGHAARDQSPAQRHDLVVGGQQHGDVAGCHALAADLLLRVVEQFGDAVGAVVQRQRFEGSERLHVHRVTAERVEHQRLRHRPTIDGIRLLVRLAGRRNRLVADLRLAEAAFGVAIPGVQRLDQGAAGAMVGPQRKALVRLFAGAQVGGDVAAAETVDGLLGVADHHQRAASAVDPLEDRELALVGVLELVDQRDRVGFVQAVGQHVVGLFAAESLVYRVDQHRERHDVALACAPRHFLAAGLRRFGQYRAADEDVAHAEQRAQRLQREDQRVRGEFAGPVGCGLRRQLFRLEHVAERPGQLRFVVAAKRLDDLAQPAAQRRIGPLV